MSDMVVEKVPIPIPIPKRGIVSILGSDNQEKPTLRRTLSADMSSKRWLAQNDLSSSSMKKIASSQQIAYHDSCSEGDESEEELDQMQKHPRQVDVWSSILSQKASNLANLPPYVHPLVKKSSSLSEKSLKVCTESLGSETGSDEFSDKEEEEKTEEVQEVMKNRVTEKEEEEEEEKTEEVEVMKNRVKEEEEKTEEVEVVKNRVQLSSKKTQSQAKQFPPPLASLARVDGGSVHVHTHRVAGRLVLEAVSVPSQKLLRSERRNGRLVLTLRKDPSEQEEEEEEEMNEMIRDEERSEKSQVGILHASGILNVNGQRKMLMMKKKNMMERDNRINNPSGSHKLEVVEEDEPQPVLCPAPAALCPAAGAGQSTLPKPPATTTFNSYQYFWRAKPTVASVIDPVLITQNNPPAKKSYQQKKADLVLLRGNKADCLLPSLKCCKEPRRSTVLMWDQPFIIATS